MGIPTAIRLLPGSAVFVWLASPAAAHGGHGNGHVAGQCPDQPSHALDPNKLLGHLNTGLGIGLGVADYYFQGAATRPPWALMWMAAKLTPFNELSPYRANGPVSGIRAPTFTFCAIEGGANPVRAANTPIGRRENTWVTPDKHRLARSGRHSATTPRKVVRAMGLINTEHGSQGPTLVSQSFTQLPGTAETACLIGDHTLDRWRERGFTVLFRLFQRTAFGARAWSRCPRLFSRGRLSQILPLTLIWRAFGKIQRLGRQYGIAKRIGLELDEHSLHLLQPAQMNTLCGHNAIVSVADVDFLNAIFRDGQS